MKSILITGATDGIGLETAKRLASQGHHLLVHGRNQDKLTKLVDTLKSVNNNLEISTYLADLSKFSDVIALVSSVKNDHEEIDVVINNAGIFKTSQPETESGIDVRFVVNTIAPYFISKSLLPLLAEDGRVVNLSSAAQASVDVLALHGKTGFSDEFQAYAQSKLALTIWSQELAKQLSDSQIMVSVNPGSLLASKMVKEGFGLAGNDLSIGANILLKAALSDEFIGKSGLYFDNDQGQFALPESDAQDQTKCLNIMKSLEEILKLYRIQMDS